MAEIKTGFGRRNVHCSNCGDERGGPFGHETSECQYFTGMSVLLLTKMPHMAGREGEIWETYVDRYLNGELATAVEQPDADVMAAHQPDQPCVRAGMHNCGGTWRNHDRPVEQPEDGAR